MVGVPASQEVPISSATSRGMTEEVGSWEWSVQWAVFSGQWIFERTDFGFRRGGLGKTKSGNLAKPQYLSPLFSIRSLNVIKLVC